MDLASTIFGGTPVDNMIAVDPAKVNNSETNNFITDTSREIAQGAADFARGVGGFFSDLVDNVTGSGEGSSLTEKIARLTGVAGGGTSFANLGGRLMDQAIDMLPGGQYYGSVRYGGGVTDILSNPYTASKIFGVVGDWAGDSELVQVLDMQAEVALLTTIGKEAIAMGVPQTLGIIKDRSSDQRVWQDVWVRCAEDAARAGELPTLGGIVDEVDRTVLMGRFPDLPTDILGGYKLPPDISADDYPQERTALVGTLDKVNPDWGTYKGITNLGVYSRVSDGAKAVLMQDDQYRTDVLLAGMFESTPLIDTARQMYPYVTV